MPTLGRRQTANLIAVLRLWPRAFRTCQSILCQNLSFNQRGKPGSYVPSHSFSISSCPRLLRPQMEFLRRQLTRVLD